VAVLKMYEADLSRIKWILVTVLQPIPVLGSESLGGIGSAWYLDALYGASPRWTVVVLARL